MAMTGEIQLAAPREAVWKKLNDPDVLKARIPSWARHICAGF